MHPRQIPYTPPPAISWDVQLATGRWTVQTPGRFAPACRAWQAILDRLTTGTPGLAELDALVLASVAVVLEAWAHPTLEPDPGDGYDALIAAGWADQEIQLAAAAIVAEWVASLTLEVGAAERARFFGPRAARRAATSSASGSSTSATPGGGTGSTTLTESS